MQDTSSKLTLNKWLLLLLATVAFGFSGHQQYQQQDWPALLSLLLAWCILLWLIQRHRNQQAVVLAAQMTSLQSQLHLDGAWLRIADESWLLQSIAKVEMGIIDQRRAYLSLTIAESPAASQQLRRFLIPYAEYQPIQQQLRAALPHAMWLLP